MYFSRYWQLRHPDRAFCKNASSALPAHNGSCEHDNISEIVIGKDRDARNPAQALSGVSSIAEGWGTGVHFGHGTLEQKPFARQHAGAGDRPRRWCNGACPIWTSRGLEPITRDGRITDEAMSPLHRCMINVAEQLMSTARRSFRRIVAQSLGLP